MVHALHLDHVRVAAVTCVVIIIFCARCDTSLCEASRLADVMGELSPTPAHERPRISVTKIDM